MVENISVISMDILVVLGYIHRIHAATGSEIFSLPAQVPSLILSLHKQGGKQVDIAKIQNIHIRLNRFRFRVPRSSISPSHLTSVTTPAEVLAAVRQDGRALRHAAAALKEDREVAPRLQQRAMAVCLQPPKSSFHQALRIRPLRCRS